MRILEEFWYGNIEPTEYDTSSCKEYKKLLELICRNEEKLIATMTDEQKELFEKYTDCVHEFRYSFIKNQYKRFFNSFPAKKVDSKLRNKSQFFTPNMMNTGKVKTIDTIILRYRHGGSARPFC